jgi:hypothetical protein
VDQVFPAIPCASNDACLQTGEVFAISEGDRISKIDFALDLGASLTGTVADTSSTGSAYRTVSIFNEAGHYIMSGSFLDGQTYETPAWLPGTYFAVARGNAACQYFENSRCPFSDQDWLINGPTPIVLAAGDVRSGIDFTFDSSDFLFSNGFGG